MPSPKPNRPRSPKTNSQGADVDKLTAACRRRGLMLPVSNPSSNDQRLATMYINRQPTEHAKYINQLLKEQQDNDQP